MQIGEWQQHIRAIFHERDAARGVPKNFMWLVEEIGELSEAVRFGTPEELEAEFADCLAWLASLANLTGIDLEKAIGKYGGGCPSCRSIPCSCQGGL